MAKSDGALIATPTRIEGRQPRTVGRTTGTFRDVDAERGPAAVGGGCPASPQKGNADRHLDCCIGLKNETLTEKVPYRRLLIITNVEKFALCPSAARRFFESRGRATMVTALIWNSWQAKCTHGDARPRSKIASGADNRQPGNHQFTGGPAVNTRRRLSSHSISSRARSVWRRSKPAKSTRLFRSS